MNTILLALAAAAAVAAGAARAGEAACSISIAANHPLDEASQAGERLRIDLRDSQFRIDVEPWRSLHNLCKAERLDLSAGESALVACGVEAACGRYSFLFRVEVLGREGDVIESRLISFPVLSDAVEVRRARSVNLGDLRALLEAQPPASSPARRTARIF